MKKFVIELDTERVTALANKANQLGISPEDFLLDIVDTALNPGSERSTHIPDADYQDLKAKILSRYAELYQRLA